MSLGVNQSFLSQSGENINNAQQENSPGIQLGIFAECQLSKNLSIAPRADISFHQSKMVYATSDEIQMEYNLMAAAVNFRGHFVYQKTGSNLSPYVFAGPSVKIPLSKKEDGTSLHGTKISTAIDLGIGLDKAFSNMAFAPELRYSYGLNNISDLRGIEEIYFHSIALTFNFKG